MKKILPILLCIAVVIGAFAGCSGDKKDNKKDETTAATAPTTTAITTDKAKIKEADAINLIESYTPEELGLSKKLKKECSFMVASDGEEVTYKKKKNNYIKVVAVIKHEKQDPKTKKTTFTFDYKGEYFIRFDGKQILSRNPENDDFKELEVKPVPTTTTESAEEHEKHEEEHAKEAKATTKK